MSRAKFMGFVERAVTTAVQGGAEPGAAVAAVGAYRLALLSCRHDPNAVHEIGTDNQWCGTCGARWKRDEVRGGGHWISPSFGDWP